MIDFTRRWVGSTSDQLLRLLMPVIAIVLMLVVLAALSFNVLSSLRAFVNAESLWSKAQKDAVFLLRNFIENGDGGSYRQFLAKVAVAKGDQAARREIDRATPDLDVARAGFLAGGNHPDDIEGMIWLYRYFKHAPYVDRAVGSWVEGDALIDRLIVTGTDFHGVIEVRTPDAANRKEFGRRLDELNAAFTPIEEGFSTSLGLASRLTLNLLSAAIFLVAGGLLIITCLFFRRLMQQSEATRDQLALSEERLRLGFNGTNCGLWDWNIVTNDVFYSPWITNLLGYGDRPIAGHNRWFVEMVHPDDRAATLAAGTKHIVHRVPYDIEYRIRTMSGKYLWVRSRAQAVRNADGRAVRMAGSIFDISDLKAAEHQAFIQHELAQVTLAAIADAVVRTDVDGRINYCNRVAEQLLGQSFEALRGEHLNAACPVFDDPLQIAPVDLVGPVLQGKISLYENANLHLRRADASIVAIDASAAAVSDRGGHSFGAVVIFHDVSAEREHAAQLSYQASHDELTGLVNRREFERQLGAFLALDVAERSRHAIMYMDLDQLKIVNDSGGHAAGDQLIRQLAGMLRNRLREGDLLARLGGDEFGVILKNCAAADAVRIAESMRKMIFESRFVWEGKSFSTGMSIGLVTDVEQFPCLNDLMKVADAACFMAKDKGRNRVHRYHAEDHELSLRHREIEWVARIDEALDDDLFCLHVQHIVAAGADDWHRRHFEVLLRMVDRDGILIPPMSFIPAAERYNLMPKIDRWVVAAAFDTLAESFVLGVDPGIVTCAINISGASIEDEKFLDFILAEQLRTAVPFSVICFEITETTAIANLPKAAQFIARLRSFGCLFSLDDFGSGMASFGYLKHLPVDFLKIDGSFVKDMMNNPIDRAMVEAINQIGHVMNKKTIAEFVENEAIFGCLKKMGVDYAQGYGIGKPEPFHAAFLLGQSVQSGSTTCPAPAALHC